MVISLPSSHVLSQVLCIFKKIGKMCQTMGGVTSKPEDICFRTRVRNRAEPRASKSESREARNKVSPTANFQFVSPGFGSQFNGWFSWNSDEMVLLHQAGSRNQVPGR